MRCLPSPLRVKCVHLDTKVNMMHLHTIVVVHSSLLVLFQVVRQLLLGIVGGDRSHEVPSSLLTGPLAVSSRTTRNQDKLVKVMFVMTALFFCHIEKIPVSVVNIHQVLIIHCHLAITESTTTSIRVMKAKLRPNGVKVYVVVCVVAKSRNDGATPKVCSMNQLHGEEFCCYEHSKLSYQQLSKDRTNFVWVNQSQPAAKLLGGNGKREQELLARSQLDCAATLRKNDSNGKNDGKNAGGRRTMMKAERRGFTYSSSGC